MNKTNKNKNIQVIIFDLDGTLVDTALYIVLNYTHLFYKYHKPIPSLETMVYFSGPPLTEIFKRYFPDIPQNELLKEFQAFADKYGNIFANLYEGEIQTLKKLKEAGYKLAVITSKREKAMNDNLSYFKIKDYFDILIPLDSEFPPKPHPQSIEYILNSLHLRREEAMIIGDSESDIQAGINASIKTGLITFGLKKKPDVTADEEFASFEEIERSFVYE